MDLRSSLETVRAFGFGGLVTAGVGTFLYYRYFKVYGYIDAYLFIGACGAVGLAVQEAIERVLGFVFRPVFNHVKFRRKLITIDKLVRENRLSPEAAQALIVKVCEKRLLE